MRGHLAVGFTERFKRDYKTLPPDIQRHVEHCIKDFCRDPLPESRRPHRVNSSRPKIFSMDVTANKSYKLTFTLDGNVATLMRVGTHKEIDRSPQ